MTLQVIKSAFIEGRETDITWEKSKAKRDEIKLETFANNADNFNGRKLHQLIPLEQVCPETGKVLRTFGSRMDAARWIVANVLKREDPKGQKAQSLTGNMAMCMALGYKSYGFYWRTISETTHVSKLLSSAKKMGSTAVYLLDNRTQTVKPITLPSIAEAAKFSGVSERQIRRIMADGSPAYNGIVFRAFNARTKTRHFKNAKEAAEFFGVKPSYISKVFVAGSAINNIKFTLDTPPKELLKVYSGRKLVGTFGDPAKAARYIGVARSTVARSLKDGGLIKGEYRCERVHAKVRNPKTKKA